MASEQNLQSVDQAATTGDQAASIISWLPPESHLKSAILASASRENLSLETFGVKTFLELQHLFSIEQPPDQQASPFLEGLLHRRSDPKVFSNLCQCQQTFLINLNYSQECQM